MSEEGMERVDPAIHDAMTKVCVASGAASGLLISMIPDIIDRSELMDATKVPLALFLLSFLLALFVLMLDGVTKVFQPQTEQIDRVVTANSLAKGYATISIILFLTAVVFGVHSYIAIANLP